MVWPLSAAGSRSGAAVRPAGEGYRPQRAGAEWRAGRWAGMLVVGLVLLVNAYVHGETGRAEEAGPSAEAPAAEPPAGPSEPVPPEAGSGTAAEAPSAAAGLSLDEVAEVVIRILAARKDKADAGPLAAALVLRLPRVELYVLGEFSWMGPQVASYRPLVEGLLERTDESVRAAAATVLGKMGDPAAADRLLVALRKDPSAEVRAAAAEALGALRQPAAGEALVEALEDPAPEVRRAAVLAVAQLKWASAGAGLARRLGVDQDAQVREHAAYALGELGGSPWVDILAGALARDPSSRVRLNAADALGKARAQGSLEALVAGLEDQDVHVREAVAVALGRLGDARAVAPLEQVLESARTAGTEPLAERAWQTILKLTAGDRARLWQVAAERYRRGDRERSREAGNRLLEQFASAAEGSGEVWSARVLLGLIAGERGDWDQAENLLGQALAALAQGQVPQQEVEQMKGLLGVEGPLREFLMERLAGALASAGRGRGALRVLDELARRDPDRADDWWGRRYAVLEQMAQAGEWAAVDFYLKGAAEAGPQYGGGEHQRLAALAQRAADALDRIPVPALVSLWLRADGEVARNLEPRVRARAQQALAPLVEALGAPDVDTRRRALGLLRSLSGRNFDFDPEADLQGRLAALARWKAWLRSQTTGPAASPGPEEEPGPSAPTREPTSETTPAEPADKE